MNKKYLIILGISLCFSLNTISIYGADYEYDDLGRVTKTVYEDGSSVTYTYDANGNIVEIAVDEETGDDADEAEKDADRSENDADEVKNGDKDISEKHQDKSSSEEENSEREGLTEGADKGNGLEHQESDTAEPTRATGMEQGNQGLETEGNVETIEERSGKKTGSVLGEGDNAAEESFENDKANVEENTGKSLKYLVAAAAASGAAVAAYLKNKRHRAETKTGTEAETKENGEGNYEL